MSTGFPPQVHAQIDTRSGGLCEVCGQYPAQEHHHRRARAAGGTRRTDTNVASNALACCRNCHRLIESHRLLALTCGWLVPQHDSPLSTPVVYRGRSVFLSDSGEVLEEAA